MFIGINYKIAMSSDVRLSDFRHAPVVTTHFEINQRSEELRRFGLWWKLFDLVTNLGVWWRPKVLPEHTTHFECGPMLLGGFRGNEFLIQSRGLVQPRAGTGLIVTGIFRS